MPVPFLLAQSWHELDFYLGGPDDLERFPWSAPVAVLLVVLVVFSIWRGRRAYLSLPAIQATSSESPATVTIVIPARNEEANIAECIKSLHGYRVIVVDDASEDRTKEAAKSAGAEVITAPALARGIRGKPNACGAGARLAETEYILFLDADVRVKHEFISAAVRYAVENQCILLSPFLKQRSESFGDRLMLPFVKGLFFAGINVTAVHHVTASQYLANGGCMLLMRDAYEFIAGHSTILNATMDDLALVQKLKRHRMKVQLARAEDLGEVRGYPSMGALWRGLRKNSAAYLHFNRGAGMKMGVLSLALIALGPAAAWLVREEQLPFLGMLAAVPLVFSPWYGGVIRALLAFAAAYVFQSVLLVSTIAGFFGLRSEWKGRPV